MKTLGELYDRLKAIEKALDEVAEAETALGHGGDSHTLKWKTENVKDAEQRLENLRGEDLT